MASLHHMRLQGWAVERHSPAKPDDELPPVSLAAARSVAARATPADVRLLAHLVGGTLRTFDRSRKQGSPCAAICPGCADLDTPLHRVLACSAGGEPPAVSQDTVWSPLGLPRWPARETPSAADGVGVQGWVLGLGDAPFTFRAGSASTTLSPRGPPTIA